MFWVLFCLSASYLSHACIMSSLPGSAAICNTKQRYSNQFLIVCAGEIKLIKNSVIFHRVSIWAMHLSCTLIFSHMKDRNTGPNVQFKSGLWKCICLSPNYTYMWIRLDYFFTKEKCWLIHEYIYTIVHCLFVLDISCFCLILYHS